MARLSKFNRVVVGKATINVIEQPGSLVAEAAFVDTTTGATHGLTICRTWSPATAARVKELLESMSADLEATHFADGSEQTATTSSGGLMAEPQGLGEHFGGSDEGIPQG